MKSHWEAKAYRKSRLVSTLLNCIDAPDRDAARAIAEAEYMNDREGPKYDRVTVVGKRCADDRECLMYEVEVRPCDGRSTINSARP